METQVIRGWGRPTMTREETIGNDMEYLELKEVLVKDQAQ